jgi:flagellar basal body-associated protein FliL
MAETEIKPPAAPAPAPSASSSAQPDVISLDEIDRILKEDDPDFANQLGEIQAVSGEAEVDIESSVAVEDSSLPMEDVLGVGSRLLSRFPLLEKWAKPLGRVKARLYTRWLRARAHFLVLLRQLWITLRTLPVEFVRYLAAMIKVTKAKAAAGKKLFLAMPRVQKIAWLSLAGLSVSLVVVLRLNLMGVWLPGLFPTVINDLSAVADRVWEADAGEEWVGLYRAFPQEEIEFLFPKIVVNLRRTTAFGNPMALLELYVVMDSKDAALEVQARQKELHDLLQRAIEDQSYSELASPLGKKRVKDLLRRELNEVLTQGWVKEVLVKSLVLKP